MTDASSTICPVCNGKLLHIDIPTYNLFRCQICGELVQQLAGGLMSPIGQLLQRNALGDDRVRAAISTPRVINAMSFLDVFEASHRMLELTVAEAKGGLRTVLAQLENRLDFALSQLAGLDLASDTIGEAMKAIREARDLASPLHGRNRGIPQKDGDASPQ